MPYLPKEEQDKLAGLAASEEPLELPDSPTAPSLDQQIDAMPNAEKLTTFERWVYKKLPGVTQGSFGKVLEYFNTGWRGKVLGAFDVGAEALERGLGFVDQLGELKPGDKFNLRDAWYASSMTADILPEFRKGPNGLPGGLSVPDDSAEELATMRVKIGNLIRAGATPQDALAQVRDEYYNGLGALALRATARDAFFHIALDPISWIAPELKLASLLKVKATAAFAGKTYLTLDAVRDLEKGLRAVGNLDMAADAAKLAVKLEKGEIKTLNTFDKVAIWLTRTDDLAGKGKPGLLKPWTWFDLTPQSKAHSVLADMADTVSTRIFGKSDDPAEIVRMAQRFQAGALGEEFGHAGASLQGRTAQAFSGKVNELATKAGAAWEEAGRISEVTGFSQRSLLKELGLALQMDDYKLLQAAKKPEALMRLISEKAPQMAPLVNAGDLEILAKVFEKAPWLHDVQAWKVHLLADIGGAVAQQAAIQFGIKERGWLTRLANATKSAESLAFMRLNPAYGVRNFVNNELTMMARGVFGVMSPSDINKFWAKQGFIPPRLQEGLTFGGNELVEGGVLGKGAKVIDEALEGKQRAVDRFRHWIQGVKSDKDVMAMSQKMEQSASARAVTIGYQQYFNDFYKPLRAEEFMPIETIEAIERQYPGASKLINQAVRSAAGNDAELRALFGTNLNLSPQAVFDAVSAKRGGDVVKDLGEDLAGYIRENLPKALADGKEEQFISTVRQKMAAHIDDVFEARLETLGGEIAQRVAVGGPKEYSGIVSDLVDSFWGGHIEHALRMPDATRAAREAGDFATASALWEKLMADDDKFFGHLFKRMDAVLKGIEDGSKGMGSTAGVRRAFGDFRKTWDDFFVFRNDGYARLKGLKKEEWSKALSSFQQELNTKYAEAIKSETAAYQRIDDVIAKQIPDVQAQARFLKYREHVNALREDIHKAVVDIRTLTADMTSEAARQAWTDFWAKQRVRYTEIWKTERAGLGALQGDPKATAFVDALGSPPKAMKEGQFDIFALADEMNLPGSGTQRQAKYVRDILKKQGVEINPRRAAAQAPTDAVEVTAENIAEAGAGAKIGDFFYPDKLLRNPGGAQELRKAYQSLEEVPEDVARQAFEAYGAQARTAGAPPAYIADTDAILDKPFPFDLGLQEFAHRQYSALDDILSVAKEQAKREPALLKNLAPEVQEQVTRFVDKTITNHGEARYLATKYANFRRDSALLNYNRRSYFDSYLGNVLPFSFWTTNSVVKWAVESIDRPAMLTTYLRMRKLLDTAGLEDPQRPSRLQGKIRINLPFAPAWMGESFIDPLRTLLPIDAFAQPFEQAQQNASSLEGQTQRILQDQLNSGEITQAQFDSAIQTQSGADWEMATSEALQNDDSLKFDAFDFASLVSSPHAPLVWAYNAARGHPEDIGPFSPLTRMSRNVATTLGVEDWGHAPWNMEAKLRVSLGLPIYDKWDDYRIDRALSNMDAEGLADHDDIIRALAISSEIQRGAPREQLMADPAWDVYQKAVTRANKQASGGVGGMVLGLLGIPVNNYPVGEQVQRNLKDDFNRAYEAHNAGDDEALNKFFIKNPEYASQLALFKKPEERLRKFLVDQTWAQWNELPTLTKNEMKDQLGSQFADQFINKATRNTDAISVSEMQVYLKLLGGKPVGLMSADSDMLAKLFSGQLKLTKPETAWRAEVFYDDRQQRFPGYYDMQNAYYKLPEGAKRQQYKANNPELQAYWDWRRDFLTKNPDLVPYVTDNPKEIEKAKNARRNPGVAVPTIGELNISSSAQALIQDYFSGGEMSPALEQYLETLAETRGLSVEQVRGMLGIQQ